MPLLRGLLHRPASLICKRSRGLIIRPLRSEPTAFSSLENCQFRKTTRMTFPSPAMSVKSQHRHHGGHAHAHSHKHDNTYLTSKNKSDAGVRITRIGLFVNCFMAASKAAGGYFLNSQSLLADAAHSFADLVSDILTLGTVAWSLQRPTERFPTGYGKIESLGSLGVSGLLLAGGIGLGWHSFEILYNMWFPHIDLLGSVMGHAHVHNHDHAHSHGHGGSGLFGHNHSHNPADMGIPNVHAAWIAGGSIVVKEYLYRASMRRRALLFVILANPLIAIKIARERKSSVLASNAVHHRIDSLTSIVALAAIVGSNLFNNVAWLDPVGGLLVSLMVIKAGWANTGNAVLELADVSIDPETKASILSVTAKTLGDHKFASGALPGHDIEIREIQGVKAGQSYLIELKLGVPESLKLRDMGAVEEAVRQGIGERVRGARRVKVKFVPKSALQPILPSEFITTDVIDGDRPEPEAQTVDDRNSHTNGHSDHSDSMKKAEKH